MEWERYEALVRSVLRSIPPDTPLDRDSDLFDYGLDSFGMVSLIVVLEQEFEVEFPDDALMLDTFRHLGTAWDLLCRLRGASRS